MNTGDDEAQTKTEPTTEWCRKEKYEQLVYNSAIKCSETHDHGIIEQANWFLLCVLFVRSLVKNDTLQHISIVSHCRRSQRFPFVSLSESMVYLHGRGGARLTVMRHAMHTQFISVHRPWHLYYSVQVIDYARYRMLGVLVAFGGGQMHSVDFYRKKANRCVNEKWNWAIHFNQTEFYSTKPHFSNSTNIIFFFISSKMIKMSVSGWLNSWWARTQHDTKINLNNIKVKKIIIKSFDVRWILFRPQPKALHENRKETNQKCTTTSGPASHWCHNQRKIISAQLPVSAPHDTMKNRWWI